MKEYKKLVTPGSFKSDDERHMEKPVGESLAVPDMALSLKEIVERYTRPYDLRLELPEELTKGGQLYGYAGELDEPLPNLEMMDNIERIEYAREQLENIAMYRKKMNERAKQLRRFEQDVIIQKEEESKEDEKVEE